MKLDACPHCHSTTLQDMCTEECAMVFNIKESTTGQQYQLKMYTDVKSTFPHLDGFSHARFPKLLTYAMLKIGRDVKVSFDTTMKVKQFVPRLSGTAVFWITTLICIANVIK